MATRSAISLEKCISREKRIYKAHFSLRLDPSQVVLPRVPISWLVSKINVPRNLSVIDVWSNSSPILGTVFLVVSLRLILVSVILIIMLMVRIVLCL